MEKKIPFRKLLYHKSETRWIRTSIIFGDFVCNVTCITFWNNSCL